MKSWYFGSLSQFPFGYDCLFMGFSFLTTNRQKKKKRRKGRSTRQIEKIEENEAVSDKKKLQRGGFALALAIIKMVVLEGLPLRCRRGCRMKKGVSF